MTSKRLRRPIAVWLLWNSVLHSASAAEQTTCLSVLHSMRIGALCGVFVVVEGVRIGSTVEIA
eukprot:2512987-Ditylum_brightwellii.AAC.1